MDGQSIDLREVHAMRTGHRATWTVQPGPFGRGDCLTKRKTDGTLILAPPGVPLTLPEEVAKLLCWRAATWSNGRITTTPTPLTLNEVYGRAPDQRLWLQTCVDYQRISATGSVKRPLGSAGLRSLSGTPETRSLVGLARSASTFSRIIGLSAETTVAKRVAGLADQCRGRDAFRAAVARLEAEIGFTAVREAIIAVLCARTRSHSWRYTQFMDPWGSWTQREFNEQLHRQVDAAAAALLSQASLLITRCTSELIDVLHARSQSRRWRWTAPLRRLLASRRLSAVRRYLREQVHPRLTHPTVAPPRPGFQVRIHGELEDLTAHSQHAA